MERLRHYDYTILIVTMALVAIGVVMIYSASSILAQEDFNDPFHFLKRQSLFALAGILVMMLAMHIPCRWYPRIAYPMLLLSAIGLGLVLIPGLGHDVGGARRWIRLGGFSFQPSELAKLSLVLYLACSLARKRQRGILHRFTTGFLPHALITALFMALLLGEPDLGSAIIAGVLALLMMFLAGVRPGYLMLAPVAAAPLLYLQLKPYQWARIWTFAKYLLNPWEAPLEKAYHVKQSCYALANGGLWGKGLGESLQKLFFLPEPHTDFIASVIGEEWGFVGLLTICFLLIVLLISGAKIAMAIQEPRGALLAMGLVALIGIHAMGNIAMTMGLMPTKGMTLPFVSYGGSSLLTNLAAVGILIHLSSHAREKG